MRLIPILCLTLAVLLAGSVPAASAVAPPDDPGPVQSLGGAIRDVLLRDEQVLHAVSADEQAALAGFYALRAYAPLWTTAGGLQPAGSRLLASLLRIREAAPGAVGPLIDAASVERAAGTPDGWARLDVILSAALLRAAVDPADLMTTVRRPEVLAAVAGALDPVAALRMWLPPDPEFWRLREATGRYLALETAGGWPQVPAGPKLTIGMTDDRVQALRARLAAEGDLTAEATDARLFDPTLEVAVRRFQERHGLATDGVVGRATIDALNVPVLTRIKSMLRNLARLHARPWADERRHVIVNVAGASYRLIDDDRVVFDRITIVGRRDWPTPLLDSVIDRLDINPYWYVPPRITQLELLPRLRRDPGYLGRNGFHLVGGVYRQDPGPLNPLGVVKFLFPNRYSVYLHDTNRPELFERHDRFLSHGCIRLSNARELAEYLLQDNPDWNSDMLQRAIAAGRTRTVTLARPLPIHIVYQTAWVDGAGRVNFRKDVYGRDR